MNAQTTTTRVARCGCGAERPSAPDLAFFTSAERAASDRCEHCSYAEGAHDEDVRVRPHMLRAMSDGHTFAQSAPRAHDTFYCGCRGWD